MLQELDDLLVNCMKCGLCQGVCPVFAETGNEGDVTRGKLDMLEGLANSMIFREPVFNYSVDFPFLWDEITIPVKYGTNYVLAREIFARMLTEVVGDYVEYAKRAWKDIVKK